MSDLAERGGAVGLLVGRGDDAARNVAALIVIVGLIGMMLVGVGVIDPTRILNPAREMYLTMVALAAGYLFGRQSPKP